METIMEKVYDKDGSLCIRTVSYAGNLKISESYHKASGGLHRTDGPAWQTWHTNGNKKMAKYIIDDIIRLHLGWYSNGNISDVYKYDSDGRPHCTTGPAVSRWLNNVVETAVYYIHGKHYSKADFDRLLRGAKTREEKDILADIKIDFD